MKLSYAQRLEDYHLDLVFSDAERGIYVDVGGGHPVADNVSFHFYLRGWRGLIVEPQQSLARLYASIRPRDVVAAFPVGDRDGEVEFHRVERLHGFSTIVEQHAKGAGEFGVSYKTERLPIRRLSGLLDENGFSTIDFLKIDVEGAEGAVLAGLDLKRHRPRVMCIEAVAPGSMTDVSAEWEPMLLSADYILTLQDELNRFYVAREHAALAARFPKSPAPWDCVKHLYEFGRAGESAEHPDSELARRLIAGLFASLPDMPPALIRTLLERSAGPDGMERGPALRALLRGRADFPRKGLQAVPDEPLPLDDAARAALGRIAAAYDGGMIF
ncbi:MAG: FkbM family methyltransferase [Rhizobiales bacterium]|nr:FkbM family methyltransferase [Hyphomicrobiales bacterium]